MNDKSENNLTLAQTKTARLVGGLHFAILMAGCAGLQNAPAVDPVREVTAPVATVAPVAEAVAVPPPSASTTIATPPVTAVAPSPAVQPAVKAAANVTKAPATPTASAQKGPVSASVKAAPPPLNLKSLETRLKESKAIGLMTKLALKNQVDDLLDQFRAHYQGKQKTTLADLRRPYEMLLQKVLALLQDSDPPLAGDIVASREAIWGVLADPAKFAAI